MIKKNYDSVVIGGGAAGMAAAVAIAEQNFTVAVLEREEMLGGILQQCIHNGFGLHYYNEELTGPEYADRFIELTQRTQNVDIYTSTTAVDVSGNGEKIVFGFSPRYGLLTFYTKTVILSMGCRERNRGNIGIPGTRPAGIFTAGLAQRLINIDGYIPGKNVVIIGSGDIGLIMARRMSWVGANVLGVVEIQPYASGLTRNIVQCLHDFNIPLYLSHVVSRIYGKDRVEGIEVTSLEKSADQKEKSFAIGCDTLLLSVGLIPDNELTKKFSVAIDPETGGAVVDANLMTSHQGVFACGNVLHVHDLVDYVTEESQSCGKYACAYLKGGGRDRQYKTRAGSNVKYVVPHYYTPQRENKLYLRSLIVKNRAEIVITIDGRTIQRKKLTQVQPSEMISITLSQEELSDVSELKENILEVSVR